MNVLTIFDQRISAIFEEVTPGMQAPFSFRRLAKRAVREMEDETFVIDGVDTAPALYTILVSQLDDTLMRKMYVRITDEISQLVEAQAKKRGYTFVGRPLVRFMVDPALRSGRFSLFAENVDPRTLARLRDEENAYLGITPPQVIIADQGFMPESVPLAEEEPAPVAQEALFADEFSSNEPIAMDDSLGFSESEPSEVKNDFSNINEILEDEAFPEESVSGADVFPSEKLASTEPASEFDEELADAPIGKHQATNMASSADDYDDLMGKNLSVAEAAAILAADAAEAEASFDDFEPDEAIPDSGNESSPSPADPVVVPSFIQSPPKKDVEPSCTLTDLETGEIYTLTASRTPLGRGRIPGGVILHDPNVSRRHAEIVFEDGAWRIRDLNSTNGTIVNDVELPTAVLHDGDILTLGVTNLEFKVN